MLYTTCMTTQTLISCAHTPHHTTTTHQHIHMVCSNNNCCTPTNHTHIMINTLYQYWWCSYCAHTCLVWETTPTLSCMITIQHPPPHTHTTNCNTSHHSTTNRWNTHMLYCAYNITEITTNACWTISTMHTTHRVNVVWILCHHTDVCATHVLICEHMHTSIWTTHITLNADTHHTHTIVTPYCDNTFHMFWCACSYTMHKQCSLVICTTFIFVSDTLSCVQQHH